LKLAEEATGMNRSGSRILAGISVPDTPLVERALVYAHRECVAWLFNHVVRSWLFAARIGQLRNVDHDAEVVALGTLLHDITLDERFEGPHRFEVEGADLARVFARQGGVDERRAQLIWDSVALNSTPSIGLYREAEVALCTAGICLDVVGLPSELIPAPEIAGIVSKFPRLEMQRRLTGCFCRIAETRPEPTYDRFVRDFGEHYIPGYRAPSSVDLVSNAPFQE
jgi:HD domain